MYLSLAEHIETIDHAHILFVKLKNASGFGPDTHRSSCIKQQVSFFLLKKKSADIH